MPRISSSSDSSRTKWSLVYLGVAFTTLATLILELSLTRIFSVVFFYHFAFLAISIALFGLGAGGVFSYVVAGWRGKIYSKLGTLAVINSFVVLLCLIFMLSSVVMDKRALIAVFFASALPFFFAGAIVSLAVAEAIERVDRVYFFDLLGAAGGCLLLVPLLNQFGGPNTVLVASVLFAVSAAIWYNLAGTLRGRVAAVALALAFFALIVYNLKQHPIDVHYAKGVALPKERFVQWNSFSRIALVTGSDWASILIDADASTFIPHYDLDHLPDADREKLLGQGPGFPYTLRPGAKTLIIGPGGGWDVSRAIASGSKDVTGVEINPITATTIMRERFPDLSRRLYFRPEVHLFVEDGRSFVRRSQEKYQVLQATLVDTWASTAAGAFALSENNLYTTDAFRDYLGHLTDDGLMVFTRWGFDPPRESLRLLSLARAALAQLGENDIAKHVIVVREDTEKINGWGAQDTVVIFRKPATATDIARTMAATQGGKLQRVYVPGETQQNAFAQFLQSPDPDKFLAEYPFDLTPVDDDRPFFFYTMHTRDILSYFSASAADAKVNHAVPMLFELIGVSLLATIIVLALPPLLLRTRLPIEKGLRGFLLYFVCLGAGYIMIQVALIQKFILFLGHPTYALTVIVFSMLVWSGLGSFYSRRLIPGAQRHRLMIALLGVFATVAIVAFIATPIGQVGVGWPLQIKILVTVFLIAPAAFLMGIPFPTGLSWLESRYPQAVRWAWALNAASSVLGSASAIFLAIHIGLRGTVLVGAGLYLCALSVVWLQKSAVEVAPSQVAVRV
ncbi:MAG TPA: hypothetical protein VKT81_19045 [Bryobacteraceae bacterium]|nr:hypothetical protein [Bryobacteraceae bacterium]